MDIKIERFNSDQTDTIKRTTASTDGLSDLVKTKSQNAEECKKQPKKSVTQRNEKAATKEVKKDNKATKNQKEKTPKKKSIKAKIEPKSVEPIPATPTKKKKKNGADKALIHLRPSNLVEQKELFFENEGKVNPLFTYANNELT